MISPGPLILILDADSEELGDLYAILDRQGYLVATRVERLDALKYVSQHRPRLVVVASRRASDPEARLVEAIHELSPSTRVVILSGPGGEERLARFLSRAGDELLAKPCRTEDLLRSVKRLLEREGPERIPFETASAS